jgi:hypothetical protein
MVTRDAATAGVILAGGRASRMGGRDKAFAAIDREPIAVRTVRLFQALFEQVIVSTNRPEPRASAWRRLPTSDPAAARSPASRPPCWRAGIHGCSCRVRHAGLDADDPLAARAPACWRDAVVPRRAPTSSPCTRRRHAARRAGCLAADAGARATLPAIRVDCRRG